MKQITIFNPNKVVFGPGAFQTFVEDFRKIGKKRLFVVISGSIEDQIQEGIESLKTSGVRVYIEKSINREPDFSMFHEILDQARQFGTDSVVGIGGGSVLDVAKLAAVFVDNVQDIDETIGIGRISGRSTYLACLPTTAGTGSEVSPNAILLDREKELKQGIVSSYLVADSVYIDPQFTYTVPSSVTASTGLDALSHCLEAYTNVYAHPMIDLYAIEGIELISANLKKAVRNGYDEKARTNLSLGSFYGGLCLGPVNTTAVHALSYPLGGIYHISHGLSNAILLPHVMEFNLVKAPERFANIGLALGAENGKSHEETAHNGVEKIKKLMKACGLTLHLSDLGIPKDSFDTMAKSALKITRLLKNNVRDMTYEDALQIYQKAY